VKWFSAIDEGRGNGRRSEPLSPDTIFFFYL
jgi:hypothetical protein